MVSLCLEICWQNRIYIVQFNQFLSNEKSHSPNGRVICDLHSPDTFDTRLGERASANVQPWARNCPLPAEPKLRENTAIVIKAITGYLYISV